MPSRSETFGLVYVEALSQGLPVIFTKNEGIDGFFGSEIGEPVNCEDSAEIYNAIVKIIDNYSAYNFDSQSIVKKFNWEKIAQDYNLMYTSIVNNSTN